MWVMQEQGETEHQTGDERLVGQRQWDMSSWALAVQWGFTEKKKIDEISFCAFNFYKREKENKSPAYTYL